MSKIYYIDELCLYKHLGIGIKEAGDKKMIKTLRVMFVPNNKQKTKWFQYANTARFAYNLALGREKENYENGGKFISDADLRKEFIQLKKRDRK